MLKTVFLWTILSATYVGGVLYYHSDKSISLLNGKQWDHQKAALQLARDNRLLKAKVGDLEFRLAQAEGQNRTLLSQQKRPEPQVARAIASVANQSAEDLVMFDVYKWTPEKLLAIGEKELFFKNYEKSSQFYHELIERFPEHSMISDKVLFGAGIAAFESKQHYSWAAQRFGQLLKRHPKSPFFRGAKLWLALSHYQLGEQQKFISTVDEFRRKYRNTEEWKILSKYYEDIQLQARK